MSDLRPRSALDGVDDVIGTIRLREVTNISLVSVAARRNSQDRCHAWLRMTFGAVPGPNGSESSVAGTALWMGPDQWMLSRQIGPDFDYAGNIKTELDEAASVTEQTGSWVTIEVTGDRLADAFERLCAIPIRTMQPGEARRTQIHHQSCFVVLESKSAARILGARSSARSLWHALTMTAKAL